MKLLVRSSKRNRRMIAGAIGLLLVVALIAGFASSVMAVPGPPNQYWGQVTINGAPAPAGITITAQINGVGYVSQVTDAQGRYGDTPNFMVPADDSDTPAKDGGVDGDTINFLVNGVLADTAVFASGTITELDLDVNLEEYILTVTSSAGGNATEPGEGDFNCFQGTVVDLLAVADTGYWFVDWTGDVGTVDDVDVADTFITMSGNYTIQANFQTLTQYNLTVTSGEGGDVTVPGEGTFPYYEGQAANLLAVPALGYAFVNWTGDVGTVANATAASTTITINGDYTIQANFVYVGTYQLTVTSSNGGNATEPGEGVFMRTVGTVVDLLAVPDECFGFVNWTGDIGTVANVNAADTTITMNGNYAIQANFAALPEYNLNVSSTAGGNATEPGEDVFVYCQGTVVDLLAVPDLDFYFVNWTGDVGTVDDVDAADTFITMNDNYTIQANFEEGAEPTPTPTPTGTATPTPTPTGTATPTPSPTTYVPPSGGGWIPPATATPTPTATATPVPTAVPTATPASTATATSTPSPTASPPPGTVVFDISGVIGDDGVVQEDTEYNSPDGVLKVHIESGTTALTEGDEPLQALEIKKVCEGVPPPPAGAYIVGCAFDIGPDGAKFNPPITITLDYDPAQIPDGIAEKDLVIAYYNVSTKQWVILPSTVDVVNHVIEAEVSHTTLFAVYASATPGPTATPAPGEGEGTNIWIIIGPIIAVILLGLVVFLMLRRRTPEGPPGAQLD